MKKTATSLGFLCLLLVLVISLSMSVNALDFCESGENSTDLEIKSIDINNKDGDDDEWKLLDEIEIEVEVENDGDEDIDDVIIELGFFDEDDDNVADELDFSSRDDEEIDIGKLRDGDEETVSFVFKVSPDLEEGDYELRIKVYSDDLGEENMCTETSDDLSDDTYEKIEVLKEDDEGKFIVFDDIALSPEAPLCGESVTLTADLVNIGDEDQARVKVILKNDELGIDRSEEFGDEIEEGESEDISMTFRIPDDTDSGEYVLELTTEYDYRNGVYRQESDTTTTFPMQVLTCFPEQGEFQPQPPTGGVVQQPSPFDDADEEVQDDNTIVKQLRENIFLLVVGIITVVLAIITVILIIVVVSRH